jgi:DNA-binding MarR family transcriptional regulator
LWHQINREFHDRFRPAFRGTDLPPLALLMLKHIGRDPGVTVSELARSLGTAKSYVSKTVDQLMCLGYVEKRADLADQRLMRVYATAAAEKMKQQMEDRVNAIWEGIRREIPVDELGPLTHSLHVLLIALQRSVKD